MQHPAVDHAAANGLTMHSSGMHGGPRGSGSPAEGALSRGISPPVREGVLCLQTCLRSRKRGWWIILLDASVLLQTQKRCDHNE